MDTVQIRLETLKLAHRSDLHPTEVVSRAKMYEEYVLENLETSPVARRGRPPSNKPASVARNDPGSPDKSFDKSL
jgi:hypothetical protein